MTRPTTSASGPTTARACRCCSGRKRTGRCLSHHGRLHDLHRQGLSSLLRAAGLRDVLLHHPRRPQPAQPEAVLPADPRRPAARPSPASWTWWPSSNDPRDAGRRAADPPGGTATPWPGLVVPGLGGHARLSSRAAEAEARPRHPAGRARLPRAHARCRSSGAMFRHLAESASRPGRRPSRPWRHARGLPRGASTRLHLGDVRRLAPAAAAEHRRRPPRSPNWPMPQACLAKARSASSAMPEARAPSAPTRKRPRASPRETGVDAMAISVGNVHLQQNREGGLDEARLRAIEAVDRCAAW